MDPICARTSSTCRQAVAPLDGKGIDCRDRDTEEEPLGVAGRRAVAGRPVENPLTLVD